MKNLLAVSGIFSLVFVTGCGTPTVPTGTLVPTSGGNAALANTPFSGSFEGTQTVTAGTPPFATVQMQGEGTGSHIGRFTIALPHTVNFATSSATGTATIIAADGSRIVASFTGQAQLGAVVSIVEHATITSGTGRFADASGSFTIRRTFNQAAGTTAGTFEGTLSLK